VGFREGRQLLKDKHDYAFFFLVGALNNILATLVYFQDDIEARRLEQLQNCITILKDVPTLQEIFQYALRFCLDTDNLSDRSAAERLVGFYYQFPDLSKFTVQTDFAVAPVKKGALDYEKVAEIHREKHYGHQTNAGQTAQQAIIIPLPLKQKASGFRRQMWRYTLLEALHNLLVKTE
jgi:hypothetical protein